MEKANGTPGVNFIPLGLFSHPPAHRLLFSLALTIFLSSLLGNGLMILLILRDPGLHTPMRFPLSQLSLMDLMLAATTVPQMAASHLLGTRSISPAGCGAQIFLCLTLGGGECFPLAAMAYDRYVAICHPLRYAVLMNQRLRLHMATGSWLLGAADGLMQAAATLSFPYCHSREINHFFCEAPSLVRLACADTVVFEFFMYVCCVLMLLIPLSLILASYSLILAAVLLMKSNAARRKASATCSSHLAVVGLFFGTIIFTYVPPKSHRSVVHDKVVSAFYTVFTSLLNPLIYSVRNKDVKGALRKWMGKYFVI